MKKQPFHFALYLLICLLVPLAATAQTVEIPDANLRAKIENALGKASGDAITVTDMETLTRLSAKGANISDLTGLEFAIKLIRLNLGPEFEQGRPTNSNSVSDISPLAALTNLTELRLDHNQVSDISPLTALTNLTRLVLGGSPISDISPLTALTNLTVLGLYANSISDISPLAALTNLITLRLDRNSISDISPLTALTNLTRLGLGRNSISDISPLVENTGLRGNTGLESESWFILEQNPLNYTSINMHIPALQERGIDVIFDNRTPRSIRIVSGNDQEGASDSALASPFIVEVQDENSVAFEGVPVTFAVTAGGGTLSVTSVTTDSNGRAESVLTLGPNPGTNTVTVSVTGIPEEQSINVTAEPPPIPEDVNLDDVVNILDLVSVAANLGDEGTDLAADVNGDGIVNILDLVAVAGAFGNAAAPASNPQTLAMLTAADVGHWLAQAQTLDLSDATSQRGVLFLEQLLAALAPKETALLPNYPNPFNPETWIPYHLAEDAEVALTIYDASGIMVRRLDLGHQSAGFYESRSQAIYWDGRNDFGENVVSGVYFYTLSTGEFTATRKMLISK